MATVFGTWRGFSYLGIYTYMYAKRNCNNGKSIDTRHNQEFGSGHTRKKDSAVILRKLCFGTTTAGMVKEAINECEFEE